LNCLLIFLLAILLWHVYRFLVDVSPVFPYLKWGTPLGYVFYLGFYVLMFGMLILFVKVIDRSSLRETGLRKASRWKLYLILGALFAFLARFSEIFIYLILGGTIRLEEYSPPFIIIFFVIDTLMVGLAEEGVFRGYIQRHLAHNHGFIKALLVSTSLFHAYHVNFYRATFSDIALTILVGPFIPGFGMFAGYLYYKTGENLLGPVTLHMFYDLFGTIVPLGVETGSLPTGSVSLLRILQWSMMLLSVKILADRQVIT